MTVSLFLVVWLYPNLGVNLVGKRQSEIFFFWFIHVWCFLPVAKIGCLCSIGFWDGWEAKRRRHRAGGRRFDGHRRRRGRKSRPLGTPSVSGRHQRRHHSSVTQRHDSQRRSDVWRRRRRRDAKLAEHAGRSVDVVRRLQRREETSQSRRTNTRRQPDVCQVVEVQVQVDQSHQRRPRGWERRTDVEALAQELQGPPSRACQQTSFATGASGWCRGWTTCCRGLWRAGNAPRVRSCASCTLQRFFSSLSNPSLKSSPKS